MLILEMNKDGTCKAMVDTSDSACCGESRKDYTTVNPSLGLEKAKELVAAGCARWIHGTPKCQTCRRDL